MTDNLPAKTSDVITSEAKYRNLMKFSGELIKTGFLPLALKTPAQVTAVILTGQEMGLAPMYSLRNINIIQGKPCLASELQLTIFIKNGGKVRWIESTDTKAVVELTHPNNPQNPHQGSFTIEEARNAGLITKDSWKKYPKAMLKARAISSGLRAIAPEIQMGLYDPDEIQPIDIDEADIVDESAEIPAEFPEVPPEPPEPMQIPKAENDPASKFYHLLKFGAAKEMLGNELYYEILEEAGYHKSILIPPEKRDEVLNTLREAFKIKAKAEKEAKNSELDEREKLLAIIADREVMMTGTQKQMFTEYLKSLKITASNQLTELQQLKDVLHWVHENCDEAGLKLD